MPPRKSVDWVALIVALLALLSSAASGYFRNDKAQAVSIAVVQKALDDDRATIAEIKQQYREMNDKLDRILESR